MTDATEAPRIYPTFRCRDAEAMIAWLSRAFGFTLCERHMDGEHVVHAEMALGGSMIMLGSARDDAFGAMVGAPGQNGGKATYVVVDNPDALFEQATAAGAEILMELRDQDYGSRDFICADPEGNVWCFGTYRPKVRPAA